MDTANNSNLKRLTEKLGFDPTKNAPATGVFAAALEEVRKKRDAAAQVKAIELIEKATELSNKMEALRKQSEGQLKKFDKELGKLMGSIEAMASGRPAPEPTEDKETNEEK